MRPLRRHREFLAWLMSVAVTCNIILAMVCCAPVAVSHAIEAGADAFAGVLCTVGGVKAATPDGQTPVSHKGKHSECVLCAHAFGGSHIPLIASAIAGLAALAGMQFATFAREAPLGASYFTFAKPSSRGPPGGWTLLPL